MEHETISSKKIMTTYGIGLGITLILISVLMYVTGMVYEGKNWPMVVYYLLFPAVLILGIYSYKKKNNGFLTLTDALKVGMAIAAISGLVYALYNIIFNYFIEPDFVEQMAEVTRTKLMENPNITEEQIEMSLKWGKKMGGPIFGGAFFILMSVFFGFIYSLISGLIMQKKEELY